MTKLLLSIVLFSFAASGAIPPPEKSGPERFQTVQRQIGGKAGAGFSLLDLQKIQSKNGKVERLIFAVGTKDGKFLKGLPGYFNAQNQIRPNRVVIDFSQMMESKVNENFMKKILKDSKMVKDVKITSDPQDKTLTMTLDLNTRVKLKTLQVSGKKQTAKIVIDIIKR
jgi:hypothetical protein